DGGRPAERRMVGETTRVGADIFADSHDVLGAELLWKAEDEREWRRVLMEPLPNDRWVAAFAPGRIGRHYFSVEAWRDEFASLRRDIEIKHRAGVDVALEVTEGRELLTHAAEH